MINTINIALTGLDAASKRLSTSASNIANLQSIGSLEDNAQQPYAPLTTVQTTNNLGGVNSTITARSGAPFTPAYDPNSPFANADGLIGVSNINLAEEAVNITLAEIQYKASLKIIEAESNLTKELFKTIDETA